MTAIVLAHLADLVTFAFAARALGIGGEGNPLARWAYELAGLPAVIALKVLGITFVIWTLSGVPDSPGRTIAIGVIVALGLFGALTNVTALFLYRT